MREKLIALIDKYNERMGRSSNHRLANFLIRNGVTIAPETEKYTSGMELIDRRKIRYMWQEFKDGELSDGVTLQSIIHRMPTVDAVEVVRCKDCKHSIWDEENEMWKCVESAEYDSNFGDYIGWVSYHNADYFCADGERKEK